jgi:hypothetical protein
LIEKAPNVIFKLGTDMDIRLIEERASAARLDFPSNLTRYPSVLAGMTDENEPRVGMGLRKVAH